MQHHENLKTSQRRLSDNLTLSREVIASSSATYPISKVFQPHHMADTQQQVITNDRMLEDFARSLQRRTRSKHTVRAYLADVRKLLQFLQTKNPDHLLSATNPGIIDEYVRHVERVTPSEASVKRQVMGLRQFFGYLVRQKLMSTNPIRTISVVHLPVDAIPYGNLKRMFEHLSNQQASGPPEIVTRYMRDELFMLFMLIHGVRQYQMPSLRISCIQKENGAYLLPVSQTVILRIEGIILSLLHNYLRIRQGNRDVIFIDPVTQRPITAAGMRIIMTELTYAAGSPVTPKTIRHTFELLQANPDSAGAVLQWVADLHNGRATD